eukprot:gene38205-51601_t
MRGMDEVHHLAFVNGTEYFYSAPELVLDVGVKGMINVIDACRSESVRKLILASSSEVYQTPPHVPTDEHAPLLVPDPTNPRYSYGGGKIISELMALNYGRKFFDRVLIFRPHNAYGPDMGWEHVIPQFARRVMDVAAKHPVGRLPFEMQGNGSQTRSFCHVDDLVAGVLVMRDHGEHLGMGDAGDGDDARQNATGDQPPGLDLRRHIEPCCADHFGGTSCRLTSVGPGRTVNPGRHALRHQLMIGGVKLNLVAAVAAGIERPQLGRIFVGQPGAIRHFGRAP